MRIPEEQLISLSQGGDTGAFEGLVRLYEGRIHSFFAYHLDDPVEAEDLSQETFLWAYRKLRSFDNALPFYPWLKGIAWNALRNVRRKRQPESLKEEWTWAFEAAHNELSEDADVLEALRSCVRKLDGVALELVHARYMEGLPLAGLAARTGRDPHALSMALVRIRESLHNCMTQSLGDAR